MAHINELIDFVVSGFIVHDQKVLLILHKKLGLWLPPGGHIELHEDPEEALVREIQEECGLVIMIHGEKHERLSEGTKPLHTPAYMNIHPFHDTHRHIVLQYFCTTPDPTVTANMDELDDFHWFTKAELEKADLLPEIQFYAKKALETLT